MSNARYGLDQDCARRRWKHMTKVVTMRAPVTITAMPNARGGSSATTSCSTMNQSVNPSQ